MLGLGKKVVVKDTALIANEALDVFSELKEKLKNGIAEINDIRNKRYAELDALKEQKSALESEITKDGEQLEILSKKLDNLENLI